MSLVLELRCLVNLPDGLMSFESHLIGIALVRPRKYADAARRAQRSKRTIVRLVDNGIDKMFSDKR